MWTNFCNNYLEMSFHHQVRLPLCLVLKAWLFTGGHIQSQLKHLKTLWPFGLCCLFPHQSRSGLDSSTSWPDVQLSLISVTPGVDAGLVYRRQNQLFQVCALSIALIFPFFRSLNMGSQMFSKWKPLAFKEGFTILPVIVHPRSRGTISLRQAPSHTMCVIQRALIVSVDLWKYLFLFSEN